MPIFEYHCKKCGNKFEELVSGNREQTIPCPRCQNDATEKQMSVLGGIAMGKSSGGSTPCGSMCSPSGCAASSMGGCPHAG